MRGWVKIHRELLNKPIWLLSTPEQKTILLTLLLMVNHEENEWEWNGERYICKPGQTITSLDKIAQNAGKGISIQNVRTALVRFEKYEFLTNQSTKQSRLITICNWEDYQDNKDEVNKAPNNQLTDDQQTANNQLTTNKNDKECNNDKNIDIIGEKTKNFIPPILEDVKTYCLERKNKVDPQNFIDFYQSKNWMVGKNKMKDWKAAVRTWERNDNQNKTGYKHPSVAYQQSSFKDDTRF